MGIKKRKENLKKKERRKKKLINDLKNNKTEIKK